MRRFRRVRADRRPGAALTAAFVGGVIAGLVVWSTQVHRSRRDLFNRNALRRLAALGYLAGNPGVETARLLNDYLRWETKPALRKRAERLLSRMERHLV